MPVIEIYKQFKAEKLLNLFKERKILKAAFYLEDCREQDITKGIVDCLERAVEETKPPWYFMLGCPGGYLEYKYLAHTLKKIRRYQEQNVK